jgi:predicted TIM-barrel fold metal-dependent hydrolase
VEDILRHADVHDVDRTVLLSKDDLDGSHEGPSPIGGNEEILAAVKRYPDRLIPFVHVDPRRPDRIARLRALADQGGMGFGEHKLPLAADDPRAVELYDEAGRLGLPVVIHFEHGRWNSGFARFDEVIRQCPETTFIGHAQTWWANIEAGQEAEPGYPEGAVKAPGLTDKWLAEFDNLYADLGASSAYNGLSRDRRFAEAFVARHWSKMIWGTDCPCRDGTGKEGFGQACYAAIMLPLLEKLCKGSKQRLDAILGGNLVGLLRS